MNERTLLPFEKKSSEILIKKPAETSEKFGQRPEDRPIDELLESSIINIDKPSGPSSHQVSAYVKQILKKNKTGHSGTLDPKVTGVLPIAIGTGTRIVQSLLTAGKEYVALMHVHKPVEKEKLFNVCNAFVGNIKQLPPVKSAVKRRERMRNIYYLSILDIKGQDVLFKAGTQAGTYIRKLIHDIGQKLGVSAHMTELRRTKVGPFNEDTLVSLQELKDAFYFYEQGKPEQLKKLLLPIEYGIAHLPKIWVFDSTVDSICHGANLKVPGISKLNTFVPEEPIAIMTLKHELIAVGIAKMNAQEILASERGIAVKLSQVFMKPGIYPRMQ